jgi:hypothetical protein
MMVCMVRSFVLTQSDLFTFDERKIYRLDPIRGQVLTGDKIDNEEATAPRECL